MIRTLALVAVACTVISTQTVVAQSGSLSDFFSPTGTCDPELYQTLTDLGGGESRGFTVTTVPQQVKSGWISAAPFTDTEIPPFTPLRCFAEEEDLILVLAEGAPPNYCGWVPREALLRGATASGPSDGNVFQRSSATCGAVEPIAVSDYCEATRDIGEPLCDPLQRDDGSFRQNPIETKFMTWNANAQAGEDRVEVPLYAEPDPNTRLDDALAIFQVMQVWDQEVGADGRVYLLIGPTSSSVAGWVAQESGTVWFSKLTTWFSRNDPGAILSGPPGTQFSDILAEAPPDIARALAGDEDFVKFPVLADKRSPDAIAGTTQDPHLAVAFIGALCADGALCEQDDGADANDIIQLLEAVDILFVIDATKSMREYFEIVADAVETVTTEKASTATRFGAVTYGDFLSRSATSPRDPMQFREVVELTEIFNGDEFEDLRDADLFIEDALGDKPEAAFAAVLQAVEAADWRLNEGLRFVIHIGDHGAREAAPTALADALKDDLIFYIPIPVRGEFIPAFNTDFAEQTAALVNLLTVGEGVLGLEVEPTFSGSVAQSNTAAVSQILASLRAATEVSEIVTTDLANALLGRDAGKAADSSRYPPGFAQLVGTASNIYGLDVNSVASQIESRTVAAEGFVQASLDPSETNWAYYAAIRPREIALLGGQFDILCKSLGDAGAQEQLSNALREVIRILTGDVLGNDNDRFYAYFEQRDGIPLVNQTILGGGILDLGNDLNRFSTDAKDRVALYQKETCRTSKLLSLMDIDRIVDVPYDVAPDGMDGDLVWDKSSGVFNDRRSRPWVWTVQDVFQNRTVYLPLTYLPRPYSEL